MKVLSWINFILGLWLIFAGFTFARGAPGVMGQEVILGVIIAALAYASMRQASAAVNWAVPIAGLIALLSPAFVNYTAVPRARGNEIVVGLFVLILGVANALYSQTPVRTRS